MDIVDVKIRNESNLLSISGVVAVGADVNRNVIVVYVESSDVCDRVPKNIGGVGVECRVVGRARLLEYNLLSISGVVAVKADVSRNVIVVYVESSDVCDRVPKNIGGVGVECRVVGRARLLK